MGALPLPAPNNLNLCAAVRLAGSRTGGRGTFLDARKVPKRTCPIPRRANSARSPALLRSSWGFSDSTSLCSLKRLRHPASPLRYCSGLLTQPPLRCSARQTGEATKQTHLPHGLVTNHIPNAKNRPFIWLRLTANGMNNDREFDLTA